MNDRIVEAYSRLKALQDNTPQGRVDLKFVDEFNAALELLAATTQVPLGSFYITQNDIQPEKKWRRYNRFTKSTREFTDEPYCDSAIFRMRLEGALRMFTVSQNAKSSTNSIGFRPPD